VFSGIGKLLTTTGGGSVTTYKTQGASYLPELELLPYLVSPQTSADEVAVMTDIS